MKFVDVHRDPWRALSGDDGPPVTITPAPHLLLDLAQWHAVRAAWPTGMPVGVSLANSSITSTVDTYRHQRRPGERFAATVQRLGPAAFRAATDAVRRSTVRQAAVAT